MSNINSNNIYFASLKLIEQLYKDAKISKFMYRSILNDYADKVDLSEFICCDIAEKEERAS